MSRALLPLLGLALMAACAAPGAPPPAPVPADAPANFSLAYQWREGSLPPPYHYEYQILLGADGQGSMALTPDYPGDAVPTWTRTFSLSPAEREGLYDQLVAAGLFTTAWREQDQPPVGGSYATLAVTAGELQVAVPAFPIAEQQAAAEQLFAAAEALVPPEARAELLALREQYVAEQE